MNTRTQEAALSRELRVCPSLSDEQFLLAVQQLANSLARGCAASFFLDRGENFVQTRMFQQGDATSTVDWKASARSQNLVVKEHESQRRTVVTLVLDRSGSMTSGDADSSKYAAACLLGGGLAYAAIKIGSPAGFVLSDLAVQAPASLSSARVSAGLAVLRRYRLRGCVPLSCCLEQAFKGVSERRLVFVLSDFHDVCALGALAKLARSHEVVLVHLRDSLEQSTPGWATMLLEPSEGGRTRIAHGQLPQAGRMMQELASLGLPLVSIDPARPVSRQLGAFLKHRAPQS